MNLLVPEALPTSRPAEEKPGAPPVSRSDRVRPPATPAKIRLRRVDPHLVSLTAPGTPEAEPYRRLRQIVEQMRESGKGAVIGVCSPIPGDGKTITAINLAGALAQDAGARVLLLEMDLRRPAGTVSKYLAMGKDEGPGVVELAQNPSLQVGDIVRRIVEFNLDVLLGGNRRNATYEVLNSPRLGALLDGARRRYDYVILDAPPVVPVPDCRLIAKFVNGFLVVVTAHHTPRGMLEEALNLMEPDSVLGFVFNRDDNPASRKYEYYAYGYAYPGGKKRRRWWSRQVET